MPSIHMSVLTVFLLAPSLVWSACTIEDPVVEKTDLGTVKYCVYKGVHIMPMGVFKDLDDCVIVRCMWRYLSKCGFGRKTGVMVPPPGCINGFLGCAVKIIQDPKSSIPCPVIDK